MKLYSIKNVLTNTFNPPFVARDGNDAQEIVRKAILTGRDVSLLVELENLELHRVGFFDPYNGVFDQTFVGDDTYPLGKGINLSDIPLPDHINKMIEKLKEVK